MANTLADIFSVKRRYSRSVNLERDLEQPDTLEGYILTERSVDVLRRVLSGIKEGTSNSWTLTSVYGTGKSAFAHYLASLCASSKSKMRSLSLEITQAALGAESDEYQALESSVPKQGYFRAVAVAQREPISNTVIRALIQGAETFWTSAKRKKIDAVSKLQELAAEIELGNKIDGKEIPAEVSVESDQLPSLKLDRVYDYFIEAAGMGLASRSNMQRWVEIQDLIADAKHLDSDILRVLKTIGILNLVTITGSTRATRKLVKYAMCDRPGDLKEIESWDRVIGDLLEKGLITHRRQLDELRIWQGSDFNVDNELIRYREEDRDPLFKLLSSIRPGSNAKKLVFQLAIAHPISKQ